MDGYILNRVSTPEQKETGNSLPAQDFRLKKYADEREITVVEVFEFDESAYKGKRHEFERLMKLLKNARNPVALLCDKVDRLIRNFTKDLVTLEDLRQKGLLVMHFPSDNLVLHKDSPAADLFRFSIGVSLAKYYSDAISDNVKRANEKLLRDGELPGPAPIGYLDVTLEDERRWKEVDLERKHYIIRIFELYASGKYSMSMVCKTITEEGLRNKSGSKLTRSQIEQILTNPFYYGVMKRKGNLYPHAYEPIISKELFDKAETVRLGWNKRPFQYAAKPLAYRGILYCYHCNCSVSFYEQKGNYYGRCTNAKHICNHVVSMKETEVDAQLEDILTNLVLPEHVLSDLVKEMKDNHKSKSDYHARTLQTLKNQYDKLEKRIEQVYEDRLDRSITQDMSDKFITKYKKEQQDIVSKMEIHRKADESYYFGATKLLELSQRAWELFKNSQPDKKNELLKYLLANAQMDEKKLIPTLNKPFDVIYSCNKSGNWLPRVDSNHQPFD